MREKVLRYIRERQLMRAGDRVAVAVSGGADSVALLRVLLELREELGIVLFVAHVNHGLRGKDSDADQAFVADLAREYRLEFLSVRGDVGEYARQRAQGIEETARQLRYKWLDSKACEHRLTVIATGHTLDDQAETVLMKFLRGAGTRGLAGIYPKLSFGFGVPMPFFSSTFSGASIVRPLLGVSRSSVEDYLTALGQAWREDESNLDHRFARNRVRHELLPLLEREYNPNIRQVLSDAAELARAEEEYWNVLAKRELETRQRTKAEVPQRLKPSTSTPGGGAAEAVPFQNSAAEPCFSLVNFQDLPLALQRRLLRHFAETRQLALDFDHVGKLLRCALGELPKAELPGGWLAVRQGGCLELRAPQAELSFSGYQYSLPVPGEVRIAELGTTVRATVIREQFAHKSAEVDGLLRAELLGPELIVRNWRPGDRFWPVHSKSEEKLKRLFSEQHIPEEQRQSWPLVLCDAQIVWVQGFPASRAFAWGGRGDAVKIEIR